MQKEELNQLYESVIHLTNQLQAELKADALVPDPPPGIGIEDMKRIKALAACFEVWNYVAGLLGDEE